MEAFLTEVPSSQMDSVCVKLTSNHLPVTIVYSAVQRAQEENWDITVEWRDEVLKLVLESPTRSGMWHLMPATWVQAGLITLPMNTVFKKKKKLGFLVKTQKAFGSDFGICFCSSLVHSEGSQKPCGDCLREAHIVRKQHSSKGQPQPPIAQLQLVFHHCLYWLQTWL